MNSRSIGCSSSFLCSFTVVNLAFATSARDLKTPNTKNAKRKTRRRPLPGVPRFDFIFRGDTFIGTAVSALLLQHAVQLA